MARVPMPSRVLLPRRRLDLRRAITRDFPLKATAIVVAVIFWVVSIANAAPQQVVQEYPGRVPVERPDVPPGYILQGTLGDVGVKLRGTPAILSAVVAADLHATVDITSIDLHRTEPQELPVAVSAANPSVRVIEWTPATVTVRIEPITTRSVAVQARFANSPPSGTVAGEPAITPTQVEVRGASSQVGRIAALYATVRFGDAVTDLVQSVQPLAVDASGSTIEGIEVAPAVVQVTVPVLPTATTRTLPVVPAIRGTVAGGYWITRIVVDPSVVTVRGEADVLTALDQVGTAPVEVGGLTEDRTFQVALQLPGPGTSLLRATQATVVVSVVPVTGTRPFPFVAVQATNLGSGFAAQFDPPTISLVLAGPVPALNAATSSQVTATVDAAGRGAGTYQVDVIVRVPSGTTAQSVQPTRVTLTIRTR